MNKPTLKEAFTNHLIQARGHVDRLKNSLQLRSDSGEAKTCKAMKHIVDGGADTIEDSKGKDEQANLSLISAEPCAEQGISLRKGAH